MLQLCPECVIHEEQERGTHMNARSMTAVEVLGGATKSSALIGEGGGGWSKWKVRSENKRVRSSSGRSRNCWGLGTSRNKKCWFQLASS